MFLLHLLIASFLLVTVSSAFVAPPSIVKASSTSKVTSLQALDDFFTGGAFDNVDEEAAQLASRIKSVNDLGWTGKPLRRGNARPRHRAFGGSEEKPVQEKPNYDTSNPLCVEKWLSQDEFNQKIKASGPAADAVFVSLAGGNAFAEREVAEQKISQWRPNGKFDDAAFLKTVQQGRIELAIGWGIFSFICGFAVLGLVAPTNPGAKALEGLLAQIQAAIPPLEPLP